MVMCQPQSGALWRAARAAPAETRVRAVCSGPRRPRRHLRAPRSVAANALFSSAALIVLRHAARGAPASSTPQSGGIGERCRSHVPGRVTRCQLSRDVARRSRKIAKMSQECREMSQECRDVVACRAQSLNFTKRQQSRRLRSTLRHYNLIATGLGCVCPTAPTWLSLFFLVNSYLETGPTTSTNTGGPSMSDARRGSC